MVKVKDEKQQDEFRTYEEPSRDFGNSGELREEDWDKIVTSSGSGSI